MKRKGIFRTAVPWTSESIHPSTRQCGRWEKNPLEYLVAQSLEQPTDQFEVTCKYKWSIWLEMWMLSDCHCHCLERWLKPWGLPLLCRALNFLSWSLWCHLSKVLDPTGETEILAHIVWDSDHLRCCFFDWVTSTWTVLVASAPRNSLKCMLTVTSRLVHPETVIYKNGIALWTFVLIEGVFWNVIVVRGCQTELPDILSAVWAFSSWLPSQICVSRK